MNLEEMNAIEAEMRRRGIDPNAYGGNAKEQRSVFDKEQEKTFTQNVRDFGESLVKGGAKGVLDIVGGWGNLYDYLKKKKDPSVFSTQGMVQGIKEISGVDLNTIPGFRGAYEFGAAAAPAAGLVATGLPGITGTTGLRAAAIEAPVAGATSMAAQTIAPDSPAAQFALQASPYAIAGGLRAGRSQLLKPEGMQDVQPTIDALFHRTTEDFKGDFKNKPNKLGVSFAGDRGFYFSKDLYDPSTQVFGNNVIGAKVDIKNPAPVDQVSFFGNQAIPRIILPVDPKWLKANKETQRTGGLVIANSKEDVLAGKIDQRPDTFTEYQKRVQKAAEEGRLFRSIDLERLYNKDIDLLESLGYDGVVYDRPPNSNSSVPSQVVAFRPSQIQRIVNGTPEQVQQSLKDLNKNRVDVGILDVGRLTPGQFTGNRAQLAKEERVRTTAESGDLPRQFDIKQADDVRNYLTGLFNRAGNMNVNPEALTNQVWTSFNNFGSALSGQLKSQAQRDFSAAKNAGGLVDTTPVLQMVDRQLADLGPETPQNAAFITALRKIREQFVEPGQPAQVTQSTIVGPSGQPAATTVTPAIPDKARVIDINRLQKNISAWGEAAFKGAGSLADVGGSDMFAGVAPGQVKNFSRQVLNAYKEALDQAIDQGIPGADRLKTARDNFAANIRKIEEFANYPITKTFDVERVTDLIPEDVATKLSTLPKSQQAIVFSTLGQQAPDVANQVRGILFQDILSKADIKGAAANTPTFNIQAALKGIQEGSFDFLFPTRTDKADAIKAMTFMQKALQSESRTGGPSMMSGGEAYATTRALGGTAQSGNLAKILMDTIKGLGDYIASPQALAEVFFDPNINAALRESQRKKPRSEVIQRGIESVGKYSAATALRAGPQMSPETPVEPSMAPVPMTSPMEPGEPSQEEIRKEMIKRGLEVSYPRSSVVRDILGSYMNV